MYDITDVNIKLQEPAEHNPPVPYDEDISTTSELSKIIFKDGFQETVLKKRLSDLYTMLKIGLFSVCMRTEMAEAKVKELIKIYLCIKTKNGDHKKSLGLLKIAVEICIKHKIVNEEYVSYCIAECISLNPTKYNPNYILDLFTQYDTTYETQDVQYLLQKTRNLRFHATIQYISHQNDDALVTEEQKDVNLLTTNLLPFVDLPYMYIATQDDDVTHCQTALKTITETVDASPDVVLLMLRYGATPRHPFSGKLLSRIPPGYFVCQDIARVLKDDFMGQPIRETFVAVTDNDYMLDSFEMLQYMLRSDPYFIVTYTDMCSWNDGLNEEGCGEIRPSTLRQEPPGIQPTIDSRLRDHFLPPCLAESVPSLLRLCRYVIRDVLLQNRQLPDGIKLLQIPELLKPYLDLLLD